MYNILVHLSHSQIDAFDMADKLVADSGALRLAYSVYRDYMSENGRQEVHTVLPAVNLTETQLFFLSYAQVNIIVTQHTQRILHRKTQH